MKMWRIASAIRLCLRRSFSRRFLVLTFRVRCGRLSGVTRGGALCRRGGGRLGCSRRLAERDLAQTLDRAPRQQRPLDRLTSCLSVEYAADLLALGARAHPVQLRLHVFGRDRDSLALAQLVEHQRTTHALRGSGPELVAQVLFAEAGAAQ